MEKRSRIVIVQRFIPHYRVPFFNLFVRANADLDIEVFHSGFLDSDNQDGINFRQRLFRIFQFKFFGYNLVFQPGIAWTTLWHPPDLLVIEGTFGVMTNIFALVTRYLSEKKTLYWAAGWDNPQIFGWYHIIKNKIIKLLLGMASGAIVYGSQARDYLILHGMPSQKIWIAQNTINVEGINSNITMWHEKAQILRRELKLINKKVIVYVGGVEKTKRVDILLRAFQQLLPDLSDLACVIVGDGSRLSDLKQYVQQKHIPQIHFIGKVTDGVEAYFALANVFVLPGTGGLAINQAMALGCPVVATIADGTEKDLVIPGETGLLARVDDVEELKTAIQSILTDSLKAYRMGIQAQTVILEKASLSNMVNAFSYAIREISG